MFGRQQHDAGGIAGLGSLSQSSSTRVDPDGDRNQLSIGRAVRVAIGAALTLGGLAAAGWAIYELMSYGTCASGGPYVSARECAPDTGLKIMSIFVSTFAVLIGTGLIGTWRAAVGVWGITFAGLGALFIYMGYGPEASGLASDKAVGAGVGGLFLLMGLPGLWLALRPTTGRERRQTRIRGPYGTELSVDAPEDGGPAPIVMANPAAGGPGFTPPYPGWPNPPQAPTKDLR